MVKNTFMTPTSAQTFALPELPPVQSTSLPLPTTQDISALESQYGLPATGGLGISALNAAGGYQPNVGNFMLGSGLTDTASLLSAGTIDPSTATPNFMQRMDNYLGGLKAEFSDLTPMNQLSLGLGAASSLFNAYSGFQQNKQMKEYMNSQLALQRGQYQNNVKTYNTNMEDRQMRRVAANGNTESVSSYMNRNRAQA